MRMRFPRAGETIRPKYRFVLFWLTVFLAAVPCFALADLKVTFLDVGAGGAALVQADGQTMLIDTRSQGGDGRLLSYLEGLGVERIDLLAGILLREGQAGGIRAVLDKYEVSILWLPGAMAAEQPDGVRAAAPSPGEQYDLGKAKVTLLPLTAPNGADTPGLALHIAYGQRSFLFLPEAAGEGGLGLRADVLKAGGPLTKALTDAVSPLWVLAGGAEDSAAGDAARDLLRDSGILVPRPGGDGTITFITDGAALEAQYRAAGVTIQKSVNLRKGASAKSGKAATLSKGTVVDILGAAAGAEGIWYRVTADGKAGYVRSDLMEEISREEAERLLAEATPKPRKPGGSGGYESAPPDCH